MKCSCLAGCLASYGYDHHDTGVKNPSCSICLIGLYWTAPVLRNRKRLHSVFFSLVKLMDCFPNTLDFMAAVGFILSSVNGSLHFAGSLWRASLEGTYVIVQKASIVKKKFQ